MEQFEEACGPQCSRETNDNSRECTSSDRCDGVSTTRVSRREMAPSVTAPAPVPVFITIRIGAEPSRKPTVSEPLLPADQAGGR